MNPATQAPNICHYVPETLKNINFLVDTGAKPNLIKLNYITERERIYPYEPRTFQRVMDIVLSGLIGIVCFVYLDDVVIYAKSLEEHEEKFNQVMDRLRSANLKLQCEKCEFLIKEVVYLGHVISEYGIRPDEKKLQALKHFPTPKTVKNIQQFLGFANYYRRFVPYFSYIAKPLTLLLRKDTPFEWGKRATRSI